MISYYFFNQFMSYNFILIASAIIPAVFLMVKVYKSDRLEKESSELLWRLVKAGILSSLLALVEERALVALLDTWIDPKSVAYNIILYFVIVAGAEESSKYIFLKRRTWKNPEFNTKYDGVVYAVFVSLGFALWENISYVLSYGFATALVRAVTAVPGHACFGVFMGIFYGMSKSKQSEGKEGSARLFRVCAVLVPALIHGTYDYITSLENQQSGLYFTAFIALLFIISYISVSKSSKNDKFIR